MWLVVILSIFAYLLFKYFKWATYWKRKNVVSRIPFPFVGNLVPVLLGKRSIAHLTEDLYNAHSNKRYVGFYNGTTPALLLRDPNLIKKITIKETEVFPDHDLNIPKDLDEFWDQGKPWHDTRAILSPTFTASKLKIMFELMKEVSENFITFYLKTGETVTLDINHAFKRYANDIIVTSALGVSTNSLENHNDDFYRHGLDIVTNSLLGSNIFFLVAMVPSLVKILGMKVFQKDAVNFFMSVVSQTLKYRKEKPLHRPDMLQLMLEAQKATLKDDHSESHNYKDGNIDENNANAKSSTKRMPNLTDKDITAHVILFYFGGLESVSTTMSHAAHELAINPDIQAKLRREVVETLAKSENTDFTYENIMSMKYLDGVVSETLRKWPPFPTTDRLSVRSFVIEPESDHGGILVMPPKSSCTIPIHAIQRDPNYFPNPDKFDPERFSDENKHKIKPYTYIPFGTGPRSCIASRFALLEIKLILAKLISKFEVIPVEKTLIPMKVSPRIFGPVPDEGFWLGLTPRK